MENLIFCAVYATYYLPITEKEKYTMPATEGFAC